MEHRSCRLRPRAGGRASRSTTSSGPPAVSTKTSHRAAAGELARTASQRPALGSVRDGRAAMLPRRGWHRAAWRRRDPGGRSTAAARHVKQPAAAPLPRCAHESRHVYDGSEVEEGSATMARDAVPRRSGRRLGERWQRDPAGWSDRTRRRSPRPCAIRAPGAVTDARPPRRPHASAAHPAPSSMQRRRHRVEQRVVNPAEPAAVSVGIERLGPNCRATWLGSSDAMLRPSASRAIRASRALSR